MTPSGVPLLEAQGIRKSFGAVRALAGVDFAVQPGEVHALLGENGAGKSTLMNILFGLYRPDSGRLLRDGKLVVFHSPRDAMAAGIGMVHQHFTLVPTFTVAENLALGRTKGIYQPQKAAKEVEDLCQRVGLTVDPNKRVGEMSVGLQQRVEILKALSRDAQVLILDEPTGVLAPQEVDELFTLVRRLAEGGAGIIFITHKLAEVVRLADRVTVLRRGECVLTGPASDYTASELARAMVGADLPPLPTDARDEIKSEPTLSVVLSVKNLSVHDDSGRLRVKEATFDLREGEVLGVAGVEGSGQNELAEALTGLRVPMSGSIVATGHNETARTLSKGRPEEYLAAGGAHIPEDRRRTGLVLEMPIWENLILESHRRPPLKRGIRLNRKAAVNQSEQQIEEYEIRATSPFVRVGTLSGGNQQKVVLARELSRDPRILVAVHPTRGLDVRATAYVCQKIWEHTSRGGAALLISSELDELASLSDRIGVMHDGRWVAELPPSVSREELGLWMTRGALSGQGDAPPQRSISD
jgi:simple sugar transport system ATP-binding protein